MKLRVEDMAISFDNRRILEHVGFHVEEGEFTALIGPSGCGKSTLLNILAGLLHCEEGIFYVDDVQVTGVSSHFAYMPQDDLLLPWKNILDNVCLYGKLHGHINEAREKALQEFETFGLKGYERACASGLHFCGQHFAVRISYCWMNPLVLWMSSPAMICRTGC